MKCSQTGRAHHFSLPPGVCVAAITAKSSNSCSPHFYQIPLSSMRYIWFGRCLMKSNSCSVVWSGVLILSSRATILVEGFTYPINTNFARMSKIQNNPNVISHKIMHSVEKVQDNDEQMFFNSQQFYSKNKRKPSCILHLNFWKNPTLKSFSIASPIQKKKKNPT